MLALSHRCGLFLHGLNNKPQSARDGEKREMWDRQERQTRRDRRRELEADKEYGCKNV